MNILIWVILGGLAGWIATLLTGTDAQFGVIGNIIVGVVGAFLGGWLADRLKIGGKPGTEKPNTALGFVTAVVGAVILLLILNLLF